MARLVQGAVAEGGGNELAVIGGEGRDDGGCRGRMGAPYVMSNPAWRCHHDDFYCLGTVSRSGRSRGPFRSCAQVFVILDQLTFSAVMRKQTPVRPTGSPRGRQIHHYTAEEAARKRSGSFTDLYTVTLSHP